MKMFLRLMFSRQDTSGSIYAYVWDSNMFHHPTGPADNFKEFKIANAGKGINAECMESMIKDKPVELIPQRSA
jgi:hypothetical protein